MMRAAPAMRAPWTTEIPIPPRPITSTVEPGSTLAVFSTAPTPVWTAQPMTLASSRGMSGSTPNHGVVGRHHVLAEAPDSETPVDRLLLAGQGDRPVGQGSGHE